MLNAVFWRPRLHGILLTVNLVIMVLPLGGIAVLRIYESALIRQTESELIAQGAFVAASYRAALESLVSRLPYPLRPPPDYGAPVAPQLRDFSDPGSPWRPRPAVLDLANETIRPPAPDGFFPIQPADPLAEAVGRTLARVLRDAQAVTLAGIRVVDFRGVVVASTGEGSGLSLSASEEVRRALQGEWVSLLRQRVSDEDAPPLASISRGTGLRVFVAMPIVRDERILGAVLLSRTPRNILQALYGKRYPLLYGTIALLGVVLALSVFTSLTITRPVQALIRQTERAVRGEQGAVAPLEHPVTREIAQLSEAVAAMARTLERRADYIRDFASQVSHEFKTPLAAIRGAVELLRDHADAMSEAERTRFLDNLDGDAERMQRLVQRLLELARADVMPEAGRENGDLAAVLERVAERCRRLDLPLAVAGAEGPLKVAVAEDILESMLNNLIDNARQHGGPNVGLSIVIFTEGSENIMLIVADDGPGVSAANADKIFEPFFTTDRKRGGTGLGLAVVSSLLAAHRGSIRLRPSETGAAFELRLPKAAEQNRNN